MEAGAVIWITGLSGAGKSTCGRELKRRMNSAGKKVLMLDGDDMRDALAPLIGNGDYSRAERLRLAFCYCRFARMLATQGQTVIVATISMFSEIYEWNRANQPGYLEVFIDTNIDELKRRDSKGLYQNFQSGKLSQITGLDLLPERPKNPNLVFAGSEPVSEIVDQILELYEESIPGA